MRYHPAVKLRPPQRCQANLLVRIAAASGGIDGFAQGNNRISGNRQHRPHLPRVPDTSANRKPYRFPSNATARHAAGPKVTRVQESKATSERGCGKRDLKAHPSPARARACRVRLSRRVAGRVSCWAIHLAGEHGWSRHRRSKSGPRFVHGMPRDGMRRGRRRRPQTTSLRRPAEVNTLVTDRPKRQRRASYSSQPSNGRLGKASTARARGVPDRTVISGGSRSLTGTPQNLSPAATEVSASSQRSLQAGAQLLPALLPRPRPATDAGRRVWNIGPGGGHSWTGVDGPPSPTD